MNALLPGLLRALLPLLLACAAIAAPLSKPDPAIDHALSKRAVL